MNIQTEKIELVKRLLDTDDEFVIQQVKEIFESHEKDFWTELPQHVKEGIERSRKQAEAGLLTPHDEVMKKYINNQFLKGYDDVDYIYDSENL